MTGGNGYEQIYLNLISRIKKDEVNFKESAERLGLKCISDESSDESNESDEKISVNFLRRDYIITKEGVEPIDGKPVGVNHRNVLLYYVLSKGNGEPKFSFVPLGRLTGMISGQNIPTDRIMNAPLIRKFRNDLTRLKTAVTLIGGDYEGTANGGHLWLIKPLPKIPVKMIYYEADEEFPADIQIMFDETAPKFMEYECLAFLCGCLVSALIENAD